MNTLKAFIIALSLIQLNALMAQIKLPKLISDGMVLQRDIEIRIRG